MVIGIRAQTLDRARWRTRFPTVPKSEREAIRNETCEATSRKIVRKIVKKSETQAARTRASQPEPQIWAKGEKMKAVIKLSIVLLLASALQAQTATPKKKAGKPNPINAE